MRLVLIRRTDGIWVFLLEFPRPWAVMNFWAGRFSHPSLCLVTVESAREDYGVIVPARTAGDTP